MGCTIQCPHGARVTIVPGNTQVKVGGNYALLVSDTMIVTGCPFTPGGTPSPCVTIQWAGEATRDTVSQTAVLLQSSVGMCQNAQKVPQGAAIASGVQTKVSGR
jgi:hypothetical protein